MLLEESVCYDLCSLLAKLLLAFALLHSVHQGQIAYYSRYFLDSYFCISVRYNEKNISLGVLVLEGLVGLQLLQHYWLGHRLRLL